MGVELEVWRARIGLFCGGRGSKKLKALLAYRRLFRRDAVAWATGETTNCTPIAIQAIIACLPLLLILRFLGSCWNKIKCTHLVKFHGGLSYLWNKDAKTLVSSAVRVALVLSTAVLLYRRILLILAGDVELNPGPQMNTALTCTYFHQIHTKLHEARAEWFNLGQCLEVDHTTLCSIRDDRKFRDDTDRLREMLVHRLRFSNPLTWTILCDCLREPIVARGDVASKLEKKLEEEEKMQQDTKFKVPIEKLPGKLDSTGSPSKPTLGKRSHLEGIHDQPYSDVKRPRLKAPLSMSDFKTSISAPLPTTPIPEDGQILTVTDDVEDVLDSSESTGSCTTYSKRSVSFPSLRRKEFSEREFEARKNELESESTDMDITFNRLSTVIYKSLRDRNVSKDELIACLAGINSLKKVYSGPNQCVFRNQRQKFEESKSIAEVWLIISDYFSFFNYELIKHIAYNLGTQEDIQKIECYEEVFRKYAKRRIYECPSEFGSKLTNEEGSADLIVKLDQTYDECEVCHLKVFERKLSDILQLECGVMRLCRVHPGCYELIFQVSCLQESGVFPLSAEQEAALKALHVLFLTCGDYKFFSRTIQENQVPSDDNDDDDNLSDDGHAESLPTQFDASEYEYSSDFLLERSVRFNPKKIPSSHTDSGVGKSVTSTQTKKSEFSEVTALCDEDKHLYAGDHFQAFDLQRTSDELPPLVKPASSNLHPAAWNGDIVMIRFVVEVLHCNVLEINRQGYSALHVAAEAGNLDIIKYLVENRNVNPSTESTDQMTPLHIAAHNGHQQLVEYFVREQLMDPLCLDKELFSPLHYACGSGNLNVIKFFIRTFSQDQAININDTTKRGHTILHFAADSGSVELVNFLIMNCNSAVSALPVPVLGECDVNVKNQDLVTPLMIAAQKGRFKVVTTLVERGADVNAKSKKGNSALSSASESGHVQTVEILLQKGAHVNSQNIEGNSALYIASQNGHVRTVEILLQKGADVNSQNIEGTSALYIASQNGHVQTVEILLQKGAHVNSQNIEGTSALYIASQNGHVQTVEILLQKGAHVNSQDNKGISALYIASQNGHVRTVEILLQKGAHVNSQDIKGNSALYIASQNGYVRTVEILLQKEAHMNSQNIDLATPLMIAAQKGHVEVVTALVERGADVNAKSKKGNSALYIASHNGHVRTVEILLQNRADVNSQNIDLWTPLMIAARNGHVEVVTTLVERGADVNAKSKEGDSALFFASQNCHVQTVEILLQTGAHVNSQNIKGISALYVASQNGHVRTVEILLQKGAHVNSQNIEGNSALYIASQNGHVRTVEILLQKGAHTNSQNIDLRIPLMIAAQNGHVEVVTTLVERGADVNAKSKDFVTPLMLAAHNGHIKIVTTLVERGADVNAKNKDLWTPLMFAAQCGHVDIARTLVERGADVNAKNKDLVTPLMIAAHKGCIKVVTTLLERGADVNAIVKGGRTALMVASDPGVIQVLTSYRSKNL